MLSSPAAAPAQEQAVDLSAPPVDEYTDIPPGLMMSSEAMPAPKEAMDESDIMTMDDILKAYTDGRFDVVYKHIVPIANGNYPLAQEMLGVMYRNGQGVTKDPTTALTWLTKAAEAGRPLAQHHLANMAFAGEGAQADAVKSLMWLYIAIVHYPEGAEKKQAEQDRDNVSAQLSRRDRQRAMTLAKEWLEKHDEGNLTDAVK